MGRGAPGLLGHGRKVLVEGLDDAGKGGPLVGVLVPAHPCELPELVRDALGDLQSLPVDDEAVELCKGVV